MSDLRDLYQEVILDHGKNPRNRGSLNDADCKADGYNPLCGDRVTIFARTHDDQIEQVTFEGEGCAICTASASLMTQEISGRTRAEAEALFHAFHEMVTGAESASDAELGKLIVLGGVQEFPMRVKCATLPWHTLNAALDHREEPVTSE